jgi:hypothetical protein
VKGTDMTISTTGTMPVINTAPYQDTTFSPAITWNEDEDRLIQAMQELANELADKHGVEASKYSPKLGMCWLTEITQRTVKTGGTFKKRGLGDLKSFKGEHTSKNLTYTSEGTILNQYRKAIQEGK